MKEAAHAAASASDSANYENQPGAPHPASAKEDKHPKDIPSEQHELTVGQCNNNGQTYSIGTAGHEPCAFVRALKYRRLETNEDAEDHEDGTYGRQPMDGSGGKHPGCDLPGVISPQGSTVQPIKAKDDLQEEAVPNSQRTRTSCDEHEEKEGGTRNGIDTDTETQNALEPTHSPDWNGEEKTTSNPNCDDTTDGLDIGQRQHDPYWKHTDLNATRPDAWEPQHAFDPTQILSWNRVGVQRGCTGQADADGIPNPLHCAEAPID